MGEGLLLPPLLAFPPALLPLPTPPYWDKMLEGIETGEGGEASYPPASRDLVVSAYLYNLGFLRLAVLGEYQSAAEVLGRARSLRTPILGEVHALTVQAVVSRGHALTLTGDTTLAVDELTRCAPDGKCGGEYIFRSDMYQHLYWLSQPGQPSVWVTV